MAIVRTISCIIAITLAVFTPATAFAQRDGSVDVPYFNSWMAQDTATGSWGGARSELEEKGLTFSVNYTTDIGGNPTGGKKRTAKYSGCLTVGTALDFEKMTAVKGLALKVTNYLLSGRDLSAAIGNFYGVQEVYSSGNYYLGELDLSLALLDDMFVFEVGRIFAGDVFAVPPTAQYYLTSAVNGRLAAIPADVFFPHYQVAAWGARATFQPNKDWYLIGGFYNADPNVAKVDNHGADFSFDTDQGYLAVGQLTYKHAQNKEDPGLPGSVSFGSYYESNRFTDLADPSKRWSGNYGYYILADQMIWEGQWPDYNGPAHMRSGAMIAERYRAPYHQQAAIALDRPKGLTAWCGAAIAPEIHINTQTYELATGLVYQGLPPGRDRDVTAFCFILGHFSEKLEGQTNEMILELNHRFQAGPWFYITPDIQCVINPNGRTDVDPAVVLGFEASFNF